HLERRDPGPLALPLLQRGDVLPAAVAERAQLVELGIVALADHAAVAQRRGRTLLQTPGQFAGQVGEKIELVYRVGQGGGATAARQARRRERAQRLRHVRQPEERVAERAQLSRRGTARRGPPGQALDVAHAVQRLPQPRAAAALADRHLGGDEPVVDPTGTAG